MGHRAPRHPPALPLGTQAPQDARGVIRYLSSQATVTNIRLIVRDRGVNPVME